MSGVGRVVIQPVSASLVTSQKGMRPVTIGLLTARGQGAIEAALVHRAAISAELAERIGPRRVEGARRLLPDVIADLGADTAVRNRHVRPPSSAGARRCVT